MIITKKRASVLEGLGLTFILSSFFVQILEIDIEGDIQEQKNYQLHKKMDYIWRVVAHDYSVRYPAADVHSSINFKYYSNDYTIYDQDNEKLTQWQKLVKYKWVADMRLCLFILGSIMLILPKFISVKE